MIRSRLEGFQRARKCTLLGVGPMSALCVDAAIGLANKHAVPLMLIASRRQVDSAEFGGGYVEGWTTHAFAQYVKSKDTGSLVTLARDHGGPWQNAEEFQQRLTLEAAMRSAKRSLEEDLDAGFEILHLDPSIEPGQHPCLETVLDRVFELYEFCWEIAARKKLAPAFEVGSEEQRAIAGSPEQLEYVITRIKAFCSERKIPPPFFVVAQTGTLVIESRNVGELIAIADSSEAARSATAGLRAMLDVCNRNGVWLKQHNSDYLPDHVLAMKPALGLHAVNVAPEFGVVETRSILGLCRAERLAGLEDMFLSLSYDSGKWHKWMAPGTNASDFDRSVIAGHYVFSHPQFIEAKAEAKRTLGSRGIDMDEVIRKSLEEALLRYLVNLRLI